MVSCDDLVAIEHFDQMEAELGAHRSQHLEQFALEDGIVKGLDHIPFIELPRSPLRFAEAQVEKRLAIWPKSAPFSIFSLISRHCFRS